VIFALQIDILQGQLQALYKLLYPASKRMNWLSLTVNDYVNRCNFAIGKFTSLVHQLQKNVEDAEERLHDIETADLFRLPEYDGSQLPDVTVFFDRITQLRAVDVKTVVRKYNDIGPILTKVSSVLIHITYRSVHSPPTTEDVNAIARDVCGCSGPVGRVSDS